MQGPKKLLIPPLIKLKILLNGTLNAVGIYDSGSNVSLINSKILRIKKEDKIKNEKLNLRTINGVNETEGMITIKAKIFNIEQEIDVFIVNNKNFNYEFLIGLDCIKKFKLIQNEELKIEQKISDFTGKNEKYTDSDREIPETGIDKQNTEHKNIEKFQDVETKLINFNEHVDENNFQISINHINYHEKSMIENLIEKYKSLFAKDKYDVGAVKDYEARIDLIIDKYCSKRPYRCTIEDKLEIEQQISALLKKKLIEESYSPFAAPVTLAYKRDENRRSRLCIDFRDLNKIIIPQSQPFPLIEDLVIKTRNCKYFSKLDINSAFWSIPLRVEDRRKTGFITHEGHFQWTCLPFGLKTSPAIFQRILSSIIRKHKLSDFTVNYIDDILIFSKSFVEHINHLTQLLEAIKKEGFRLKFSKCTFALDSVTYLGHIIKNNSVSPIKDNLISIRNFPVPRTQKHVRQFLGKINFYNNYVPNISITLDPLHNLLRKGQNFNWTEECQDAFEKMKNFLCTQPVLAIFDPERPIHIYTDASLQGLGAVLKQPQLNEDREEEVEKPVAYFSKKLNEAQKKKKAIYLECLAIKEAVKYWRHWLLGRSFKIFSDHKPLEKMNIKARTDEELGDLTYYLSQYDFQIIYNPGRNNLEADCLSRNPVLEAHENEEEEEEDLKIVNLIKLEDILEDQRKHINLQSNKNKLKLKDGLYYKRVKKKEKIILSENFSKELLKKTHRNFCHIGIKQMENKIKPYYTAKNLMENLRKICKGCEVCIRNKSRGQSKFGLLSQLGPARVPFEIMSIDTIGGFGGSRSTKKYLHLLVDHFTRFGYIITSKTQNSNDFIKLTQKALENNNIGMILTDQYPGINSKEFKNFLNEKNIPIIFTAVNTPFSNGLNERLNQTLVNKIRCKINEEKRKKSAWTTIAHECIKKYNETEHTVTGFSPEYLLHGTDSSILPNKLKQRKSNNNLRQDRQIALENSIKYHTYNKQRFDKNRKDYKFNLGQLVYIENGNRLNRKKLDELRIGPYNILEKISNSIYKIDTGHRKSESNLFHITKLIPASDFANTEEEDDVTG